MDLDFLTLNSGIRQHQRSPNFPRVAKIARLGRPPQKYRPAKPKSTFRLTNFRVVPNPRARTIGNFNLAWRTRSEPQAVKKRAFGRSKREASAPPPLRLEQVRLRAQSQFRCGPFDVYHEIGEDKSDTRQDRRVTKPRVT